MHLRFFSVVLWLASVVALSMGFHKMFVYENFESPLLDNTNAYVGADAYNFVINGNYATGYFVLFGALLITGFMCEILLTLNRKNVERVESTDVTTGVED